MGSNSSKTNSEIAVSTLKNDLDVSGNPDPRSPTPEIVRTPLQNKNGGKHNITKNVDLRKTFEAAKDDEKLIHNNPILSAVIKNHLQSYDPRSPTQDFERTPIVLTSKIEGLSNNLIEGQYNCASPALQTESEANFDNCAEAHEVSPDLIAPKNLCDGFYDMSLNDTLKESEEPLGSSTASNDAIEENVNENKPTILLETNFDYVENDNDVFEDSEESNQQEVSNTDISMNGVPVFKILESDPRSPSIGIERTPIVVAKLNEDTNENNVEDMSDDTLIKVLQNTNAELRQSATKNCESLLVYEDETANLCDTPKKINSANNSGSRTPLSCMKNKTDAGHARSKSANMLYDPKHKNGQSKIPRRVSHIPRLKSLCKQLPPTMSSVSLKNISKTSVMGGDCENTPPHSHRDIWDKDNSIVL